MKRLIKSLLLLVVLLTISSQVYADGWHLSDFQQHMEEPNQKAVISWDGQTETMILSSGVKSSEVSNFAWVIPIQSYSKPEVTAGDIAGLAAGGLGGKVVKGVAGKVAGKAAQKAEDLAFKKAFAAGKQFQKNKISNFASKFPTTAKDIIAYGKQPVFKETVKSSFGKLPMSTIVKRASVVAGGLSGIDAIATWAAVDNIASATAIRNAIHDDKFVDVVSALTRYSAYNSSSPG